MHIKKLINDNMRIPNAGIRTLQVVIKNPDPDNSLAVHAVVEDGKLIVSFLKDLKDYVKDPSNNYVLVNSDTTLTVNFSGEFPS